jgi:MFS family permease
MATARPAAAGGIWRQRAGLAVVCVGTLVAPLDSSVNIALPRITDAFAADIESIRWVVICYVLTYSSLLLVFGKIGDLAGYRRVFQAGLVVSSLGFLACALAGSYATLLAGRVLQGIGIALTLSCAPALATTLFDESQRTRVLGIYAAMTAVGAALGPIVGGALVEVFGWSVVFARPPGRGALRFDWVGALLLVGWLVPLLLALSLRGDAPGLPARAAIGGIGALMLTAFIVYEARHGEPIIRPQLFRNAEFALMNAISVLVNFAAFSILLLVPYFIVRMAGLDAASGGLVLALGGIGTVGGAWLAGRLGQTIGIGRLALAGVLLSALGLALIGLWSPATPLAAIAFALLVQGIGVGLFQVAYADFVTAILPVADRGVAGSLTMVTRTIGIVAGASAHSALHRLLERHALAAGVSPEAAFLEGFRGVFLAASATVLAAVALSCLRFGMWRRRSA